MMPPAICSPSSEIPKWCSSGSPANRKTTRMAKTISADLSAIRSRSDWDRRAVSERKTGRAATGLTIGKSAPNISPVDLTTVPIAQP